MPPVTLGYLADAAAPALGGVLLVLLALILLDLLREEGVEDEVHQLGGGGLGGTLVLVDARRVADGLAPHGSPGTRGQRSGRARGRGHRLGDARGTPRGASGDEGAPSGSPRARTGLGDPTRCPSLPLEQHQAWVSQFWKGLSNFWEGFLRFGRILPILGGFLLQSPALNPNSHQFWEGFPSFGWISQILRPQSPNPPQFWTNFPDFGTTEPKLSKILVEFSQFWGHSSQTSPPNQLDEVPHQGRENPQFWVGSPAFEVPLPKLQSYFPRFRGFCPQNLTSCPG